MTLLEFLLATQGERVRSGIMCADGFRISVQASEYHRCSPKVSGLAAYTTFELGFPSEVEPMLEQWAERPDKPLDTVYDYVPTNVVEILLAAHGGISHVQT